MNIQIESKVGETETILDRATDEFLIVAEGFVSNLWAVIADEAGIMPTVKHELSPSTMALLGDTAARLILNYSD